MLMKYRDSLVSTKNEQTKRMQMHFQKQLVSNRAVEPKPKNFEWWSRSLKFEFPFNRHRLWSKPIVQI